ncbi:hypothetical protein GWI34_18540 [Actinomadura sp. DSM 109109]|nr:hypothetical protein [Actinomadura lepetitiana]
MIAYSWFFETCDETVLDDDTALKQQEYVGYVLDQLSDADKRLPASWRTWRRLRRIRPIGSSWERSPLPWAWWSRGTAEAAGLQRQDCERPAPGGT